MKLEEYKQEFLDHIDYVGRTIKCAKLQITAVFDSKIETDKGTPENDYMDEVSYFHRSKVKVSINLPEGYTQEEYDNFVNSFDINVPNKTLYNVNKVYGMVWYKEDASHSHIFDSIWEQGRWEYYEICKPFDELALGKSQTITKTETEEQELLL
jgi:hypothetical protein